MQEEKTESLELSEMTWKIKQLKAEVARFKAERYYLLKQYKTTETFAYVLSIALVIIISLYFYELFT